jgi:hypothetical protein
MQYSQKRLPRYMDWAFAEEGPKKLRSYKPTGAQTCDFTEINIDILKFPDAADTSCGLHQDQPGIEIKISPGGFGCCMVPLSVKVPFGDAKTPDKFGCAVMCALNSDPRIAGFGTFAWDSTKQSLTFKARVPGFEVDFSVSADPRYVKQCVRTRGTQKSSGFRAGQIVVTAPGEVLQGDPFETLFAPTTDLNLPESDECYAGIVMSCGPACGEQAPPSYKSGFPLASNCDSDCAPPPDCVIVLEWGPPIWYRLSDVWEPSQGCKLYYNFKPLACESDTGMIFATPGEGRAPLPMNYSIKGVEDGGRVLKLQFGQ